jgi:hypothetical protein
VKDGGRRMEGDERRVVGGPTKYFVTPNLT